MNRSDLRFLVDFNVGQAVSEYLRTAGYDVSFVGELDPRMDDVDILDLAVREGRIVVTMDTDFGELVYHAGRPHAGVLLLRMPGARREQKVEAVAQILSQHATKLAGHFCVYHVGRLRVRL
jgi:predicted nuclease of predicted toxin-antitoxin system